MTFTKLELKNNLQFNRNLYMKRRIANGYESEWVDISKYVIRWPIITQTMGDTNFYGDYVFNNAQLILDNSERKFADESDPVSFFYSEKVNGALTRHKTQFKIEIELEGSTNIYNTFWVLYGDPSTQNNQITIPIRPRITVLNDVSAFGTVLTGTVTDRVEQLLKLEDTSGNRFFNQFTEGTTDTDRYIIESDTLAVTNTTIKEAETVWSVIKRLSKYLDGFLFVNNEGNFEFRSNRNETSVSQWTFNAFQAFDDFGCNVISLSKKDGISNVYNYITIEHSTGTVVKQDTFTVGDGSFRDLHGAKMLNETFEELDSVESDQVATRIFNNRSTPKKIYKLSSTPVFLNLLDKVTLNARGPFNLGAGETEFILGAQGNLEQGSDFILSEHTGDINEIGTSLKVLEMRYDLNTLAQFNYVLEEI